MDAPSHRLAAFTGCGIELEYMIVDRTTLDVRPLADVLLQQAAGSPVAEHRRGAYAWSNELVLHLIELKNIAPGADLAALAADFQHEVAQINARLAQLDACLMPGSMHPWMDPRRETRLWPHQNAAIYAAYDRIFGCRQHGWANLQSMHVNLPFAGDDEFARLHAAVRVLLPLLPALAASSPIAGGRVRRSLDYRMEVYRRHPQRVPSLIGALVPDTADSEAGYATAVLAPMYRDIAPLDPDGVLHHEWLNARGAIPRFDRGAIEVRVIDVQECPQADLAIAAAVAAVTRGLYEGRWSSLAQQQAIPTDTLAALLQSTMREADAAPIVAPAYLALLGLAGRGGSAASVWRHLLARCAGDPWLSPAMPTLAMILDHGPLARRIVRAFHGRRDRAALTGVYRALCDCLATGRLFTETPS